MSNIIEVRNLHKHFKKVKAVDGISFVIPTGICFGLLGPNGAGKTTTIEMMERISTPSSGDILYRGKVDNPDFKQQAGIQFQSTALMDYLTVREVLKLFASFYNKSTGIPELARLCHLEEFLDQEAAKLSGGQRQRVLLALALVNDPEILFLDEPTTGLDPQSRRNFWSLIENIKQRGKTIVLTTHYMDEAERLCDQLVIIDHGKIIAEGTPGELLRSNFPHIFVCLDEQDVPANFEIESDVQRDKGQVLFASHSVERTLKQLIEQGAHLHSLQVRNPTLDDLFLKLTGHSLRD